MQELLTPLQEGIEATTRAKETSRKDREWFTHTSFVGEAAASVGWVVQVNIILFGRSYWR